jgi:hypothetical protein
MDSIKAPEELVERRQRVKTINSFIVTEGMVGDLPLIS